MKHTISTKFLGLEDISQIIKQKANLYLSQESVVAIERCRAYLDKVMQDEHVPIYGVSTGFGSLYNSVISKDDMLTLQRNLVMSHACGVGEEVPQEIVKIMLLLKIQSLSYGNSGVQLQTIQRLIDFYNHDVYPVVYQQGSLGASGDLAPLAHLSLPLLGLGIVYYKGKKYSASEINKKFDWQPITLQSKEGLALLNGTQFMSAYAVYTLLKAKKLSWVADIVAAISLDAFDGRIEPFHIAIQLVRPHIGQMLTAAHVEEILDGSEIISQVKKHVQDPYSFRCVPQVHGATKDALQYVINVVETEINSVTDNPTIFPEDELIISAGNFHGQPLALSLDFLSLAIAELGNISERRTYQLIAGKRGLPSFLIKESGLNSGFMIPQYTAASIVNQNKMLTMPNSSDSIVSSQDQEDHVSMGANAATKTLTIVNNVEKILAIELMNATQALEFRKPLKSSPFIEQFVENYRRMVPFVEKDTILYPLIDASVRFIQAIEVLIPKR